MQLLCTVHVAGPALCAANKAPANLVLQVWEQHIISTPLWRARACEDAGPLLPAAVLPSSCCHGQLGSNPC